jgi:hypothetical protein
MGQINKKPEQFTRTPTRHMPVIFDIRIQSNGNQSQQRSIMETNIIENTSNVKKLKIGSIDFKMSKTIKVHQRQPLKQSTARN